MHRVQYGPHHEDVQDVLDFLDQRALLRRPDVFRHATVKLIGTLDHMEDYWNLPEGVDPDSGALVWVDIKRRAGTGDPSIVLKVIDVLGPEVLQNLRDLWRSRIRPVVTEQLSGIVSGHHPEIIANDLEMIVDFRAAFGQNIPFIERLLSLYKAGGYPCGWDGLFPNGRIVVYHPDAPGR